MKLAIKCDTKIFKVEKLIPVLNRDSKLMPVARETLLTAASVVLCLVDDSRDMFCVQLAKNILRNTGT